MNPQDMSIKEIRLELASIVEQLIELPADAFKERVELHERREALRAEISKRPLDDATVADMRRELAGLEARLEKIAKAKPNIAAMGDGGSGQAGMAENQAMAMEYDRGTGRSAIEARITFLRNRLAAVDKD